MSNHQPFEYWQELIAGFVLGDLDPDETTEFHHLLATHPELTAEVERLEQVLRCVVDEGAGLEPPAHLGQHILSAIESETTPPVVTATSHLPSVGNMTRPKTWQILLGGLIVSVIGGLGWHDYQLQQALDQSQKMVAMLQSPHTRIFQFRGMTVAKNASGSMMVNLSDNRAALAIRDLPVTQGKFYRLWAVVSKNHTMRCGGPIRLEQSAFANEFNISPQVFKELYNHELKGFVVTAEDSPSTQKPQGPIVMSSI